MRYLIGKLAPGVAATLIALAGGVWMTSRAQTQTPAPDTARGSQIAAPGPIQQAPQHVQHVAPEPARAPGLAPITICGACGEQLQAARPVLIAEPTYADRRRAASGYAWAQGSSRIPDPRYFPTECAPAGYRIADVPVWPQPIFSMATQTVPAYVPAVRYGYAPGCRY